MFGAINVAGSLLSLKFVIFSGFCWLHNRNNRLWFYWSEGEILIILFIQHRVTLLKKINVSTEETTVLKNYQQLKVKCKNFTIATGLFCPIRFFSTLEALRDVFFLRNDGDTNPLAVNNFYSTFFFSLMHNERRSCRFSRGKCPEDLWVTISNYHFWACVLSLYYTLARK